MCVNYAPKFKTIDQPYQQGLMKNLLCNHDEHTLFIAFSNLNPGLVKMMSRIIHDLIPVTSPELEIVLMVLLAAVGHHLFVI
jgi:hypothetical protein